MEEDIVKENILKQVNKKIKRRGIKIILISVLACILIGLIGFYFIFVKETPLSADLFYDVNIYKKAQTINEIDNRELPYNQLDFKVKQTIWYSVTEGNSYFYLHKKEDGTATLYFYVSETLNQKSKNAKFNEERIKFIKNSFKGNEELEKQYEGRDFESEINEPSHWNMLLSTTLCNTDLETILLEITEVYYLYYDYENINQTDFNKVKDQAVLLWQK